MLRIDEVSELRECGLSQVRRSTAARWGLSPACCIQGSAVAA